MIARAYVLALSLFVAQRRPTTLLLERPEELLAQTRAHLPLLARAGVISKELRDAALAVELPPGRRRRARPPRPAARAAAREPRARAARGDARNARLLRPRPARPRRREHARRRRAEAAQRSASIASPTRRSPRRPACVGMRLLDPGSTDGVKFSLNVYERGVDAHRLRAQVDNSDGALDLSDGVKLDLGSTAKLRTLVTYLELIAQALRPARRAAGRGARRALAAALGPARRASCRRSWSRTPRHRSPRCSTRRSSAATPRARTRCSSRAAASTASRTSTRPTTSAARACARRSSAR